MAGEIDMTGAAQPDPMAGLLAVLGRVSGVIDKLTAVLGTADKKVGSTGGQIAGAVNSSPLVKSLGGLNTVFDKLVKTVTDVVGQFIKIPIAGELVRIALTALVGLLKSALTAVLSKLVDIIGIVGNALMKLVDVAVSPLAKVLAFLADVVTVVVLPLQLLASVLDGVVKGMFAVINFLLTPLRIVGGLFSAMYQIVKPFVDVFVKFFDVVGRVVVALVSMPFKVVGAILDRLLIPLRVVLPLMEQFAVMIERMVESIQGPGSALQKVMGDASSYVDAGFKAVQKVLADPLAGVPELLGTLRGALEAFDPYIVAALDAAFRDLTAVLGENLRPVFEVATVVVREFAGQLRPVLRALAPELKELSKAIGGQLLSMIPEFTSYLRTLLEMAKVYIAELKTSMRNNQAWLRVWQSLNAAFKSLFDSMLPSIGKLSKGGLTFSQMLARATVVVAAFAMKMLGAVQAFETLKSSFEGGKKRGKDEFQDPTGLAAAQNPEFKSIEALGRDVSVASFVATGRNEAGDGPDKVSQDEFYRTVLSDLEAIGKIDLRSVIKDAVKEGVMAAMPGTETARSIAEAPRKVFGEVTDAIESRARKIGNFFERNNPF